MNDATEDTRLFAVIEYDEDGEVTDVQLVTYDELATDNDADTMDAVDALQLGESEPFDTTTDIRRVDTDGAAVRRELLGEDDVPSDSLSSSPQSGHGLSTFDLLEIDQDGDGIECTTCGHEYDE
jgi:hypothetical protein